MATGAFEELGTLIGGRYHLVSTLGEGDFGRTYLAEDTHRFQEWCVLKAFVPQLADAIALQKAQQLFEQEAGVLYQLNHPQIPRFRELLRVQAGGQGRLFLVQDYIEGPTYGELLDNRRHQGGHFTEAEVMQLLHQLLPVLDYIHSVGVIHRDITPDNVISRNLDGLPVLIDFGGVKYIATWVEQQVGGTPPPLMGTGGYAPPEQMTQGTVGPTSDLYGLAVTALVLLTGNDPNTLYDHQRQQWRWQERVTLSRRLTGVLTQMLAVDPRDRYPSALAVLEALQMPPVYAAPAPAAPATVAVAAPPLASPRPGPPTPTAENRGRSGWVAAVAGLAVLVGIVTLVWWVASRWAPPGELGDLAGEETDGSGQGSAFSPEEQGRKAELQRRRAILGVEERVLVSITDQLFYSRYPDQQGRALSDRPEDAPLRAQWDALADEVLDRLEGALGAATRQSLGSYTRSNWERWLEQVAPLHVRSSALEELTNAQFTTLFPEVGLGDALDQPVGQVWYALADEQVRALEAGDRRTEITFAPDTFRQAVGGQLAPGEGHVYVLNLREGQVLRLNLQAPANSTRLSLYGPRPLEASPLFPAGEAVTTWSGQLPQSGYYSVVVVATGDRPVDYTLDTAADNIIPNPSPTPDADANSDDVNSGNANSDNANGSDPN